MTDDDLPLLVNRMVRIVEDPGKGVAEHGARLLERDTMLSEVPTGLGRIPDELHG